MEKLDPCRLLKTYLCISSIVFLLKSNVFAQTYHDCTSTQDFNNLLDQNSSSEEMLDLMELELAKSLSKFDKCVDSDYLETKNKQEQNESKNSEKLKNSGEESAEQKEQEGEDFEKEVVKQEAKDTKEGLSEKKLQEIDKQEGKSKKVNNEYNSFSSKNNREESLNNRNNNKKVDSVASSELSGTEITEENLETTSTFENTNSEDIVKYENDQRFDQGETNTNNGMIPEDIPQDDNDSVLEEQIRLAAMKEKDPEKKKRLWNEYRKYKGLPQKE